jgi:hypothetical protein
MARQAGPAALAGYRAYAAIAGCALALAATAPVVAAQQPDSVAADTLPAADSAQLRRDAERVRAHRRPRAGERDAARGGAAPSPTRPRLGRPTLRLFAGGALSTAYVRDDNGTTVRPGVAPVVGAEVATVVGPRTTLAATLRTSRASIDVSGDGRSWSGGSAWQTDATATVERTVAPRLALRGGLGLAWVRGPSDIAPFRFNNASPVRPAAELGATYALSLSRPLRASIAAQAYRYGATTLEDPIREPGTVKRLVVGVRYGR